MLTQKELKQVLSYDEGSGEFTWLITASPTAVMGSRAGTDRFNGTRIRVNNKIYQAHRLVWLYIYGEFPENLIDHIDCNPLNNKLLNLRDATSSENGFNTRIRVSNTSGYKGVSWDKEKQKWKAQATIRGKATALGYFETALLASAAYNTFVKDNHGDFYKDTTNSLPLV